MKTTSMRHIAVTNERLRNAIKKGVETSVSASLNQVVTDKIQNVIVQTARVRKIYKGSNKLEIELTENKKQIVKAYFNYPFLSDNMIISFLPHGEYVETESSVYVVPSNLHCHVLKFKEDSTDLSYLVIGYCDSKGKTIANECFDGDILLQVGGSKIIINEDHVQINTDEFIVNGLSFNNLVNEVRDK